VPDPSLDLPVEQLTHYGSVRLFVERARAATPDFDLTPTNADAVAGICRRLDGLPLAIELAGARSGMLSPHGLLRRLEQRLPVLAAGPRDAPERQRTLRRTLAWSYDLLAPDEQHLFRQLCVFVGGCTLRAVEDVCFPRAGSDDRRTMPLATNGPEYSGDILERIASLADMSLLRIDSPQGSEGRSDAQPRVRMLETVRADGLERLEASGEAEAVRRAHAVFYLTLVEEASLQLRGPEQGAWLARLEQEHDNLSAALGWTLEEAPGHEGRRHEGEGYEEHPAREERIGIGLRMAGALWRFWWTRGYLSEGRAWLERLLSRDAGEAAHAGSGARARALVGAGVLATEQNDYARALILVEEGLALYRATGDRPGIATALNVLASLAKYQGDHTRAAQVYQECLLLRRDLGQPADIATVLGNLGVVAAEQGDYARASEFFEESLALKRRLGHAQGVAVSLTNLGLVAREQGDYARATSLYGEGLALYRGLGDKRGIANALIDLGLIAQEQGRDERARGLHLESLTLAWAVGDRVIVAYALEGLARAALAQGQSQRAARLLGVAAALRAAIGAPVPPANRVVYNRTIETVRGTLELESSAGEQAFAAAWAAGETVPLEQCRF